MQLMKAGNKKNWQKLKLCYNKVIFFLKEHSSNEKLSLNPMCKQINQDQTYVSSSYSIFTSF